ncbi:MAG TPA: Gfo/Idh/MocA family oxidoreductase [Steroidobacteraceae bacterium]|jgi:predicted dehydrogenase|nr:Gfo/Idh/MocA family oxidoreductase [Steroidobacteraceae bacterium]
MPHADTDVRVALIGYGLGGAAFHAPLIACTPGMRLATIVTRNPERRAQAAREHPRANIVDSVQAIWDRAQDHDVVVVTTSNDSHASLAMAALAAGLPVVVDKPFAVRAAEGRALIDDARRRNLLLTVYHNRRWDSELLTVKRLLAEQAFGEVLRFESRLERWRPQLKGGWREQGAPELAGGLLYDLGTHLIDQALHLFGPVTHVYAELDRRRPGIEVDDDVFLALTHESGVRSHLSATSLSAQPLARMRVLGSRAAYLKVHGDVQEAALRAGELPNKPRWGEEPREHWGLLGVGDAAVPVRSEPGAYQQFYAGIVAALRNGAPPPVDPEDAVAGLEIIEACLTSQQKTVTTTHRFER